MSIIIVPRAVKRLFRVMNCPSEQQLAAYADQQLIGTERNIVEQHLTTCDACLKQVGFLVRTQSLSSDQTPNDLLHRAMNFGANRAPIKSSAWNWVAIATAVTVIITVVLMESWRKSQVLTPGTSNPVTAALAPATDEGLPTGARSAGAQKVRGVQEPSNSIVVSPRADERIDASHFMFRWKATPGVSFYEIQLVSEAGDVVWQQRSISTSLKIPDNVRLKKGKTYYVWIRTHMARGPVQQSQAIRFTVG